MASWLLTRPATRHGGGKRGRQDSYEGCVDFNQDSNLVIKDILFGICMDEHEDAKIRLKYLNAFVKFAADINADFGKFGFNTKQILSCLMTSLVDSTTQNRTGGLRVIRHVLKTGDDVIVFNELLIPFLVVRSLDLVLKNDAERLEAMKLLRKALLLLPTHFDMAMARCLVSLANGGIEDKDRLLRICLATLCELGVLNPALFIEAGGIAAITRNLFECQTPKIAESLCGVLLYFLDKPSTRNIAAVDLHGVAAPYCDFHFKHGWKDKNRRDERDLRFNCSRLALLSILRSWPGILHFCSPNDTSGLKAIVDVLYLDQLEVRKAVLDMLYELLGLPQPEWTDELSVALSAVDPCEPQGSWRLNEGFVVAEGRSVLPHLAKTTPSISDMHLAVLLYCFLHNGLIDALVEVIATSDTFISVRGTVLLGEILRLVQIVIPPECCNTSPALPTLLEYAAENKPQALGAITALQQFHKLLKKRPASYSLYLDYILKSGCHLKLPTKRNKLLGRQKFNTIKSKIHQIMGSQDDLIKETGVLLHKDPFSWNWNLIRIIVKGESGIKITLTEAAHRTFLKRLVDFYIPSNNKYSHMDLSATKISLAYTMVGIELIHFLVDLQEMECIELLHTLFKDILNHIKAITHGRSVHDCLFSPQHMINTQCQNYFLFIGRLATTEHGINLLNTIEMFPHLQHLATTTNNDCYVKLIVSSMDYTNSGPCRNLLEAILKCDNESSRLYATQFLLILLRSGIPNFANWGVQFLVNQLNDKSRSVSLSALSTLHEACESPDCLEALIKLITNLDCLGEKGTFLLARLLSSPSGFTKFSDIVVSEVKKWDEYFCYKYIRQVEEDASDALTLHQRGEDGKYDKRLTAFRTTTRKDLHLPPHIYGQLSQHTQGFNILMQHGSIPKMIETLRCKKCVTDEEIAKLKASIWALCQLGFSYNGFVVLQENNVLENVVYLAQESQVYSVRATAYYGLGLIATTQPGADELHKFGWATTKHNRHDSWPIIQEEYIDHSENESEDSFTEATRNSDHERLSVGSDSYYNRIGSPERYHSFRNKSSTLPANQNQTAANHKRSLSESKTFEIPKGYEQKLRERVGIRGELSITRQLSDYSNSSISSSESLMGGRSHKNQVQPLSPIPSSSNLFSLTANERKIRRHSESCKRDTHSNVDKRSPFQDSCHKLSHQDLLGYTTIHCLRRATANSESDMADVPKALHFMTRTERHSSVEDFIFKSSLSSLASVKKFCVDDVPNEGGPCYMGVCLPLELCTLFPDDDNSSFSRASESDTQSFQFSMTSPFTKHNTEYCLECIYLKRSTKQDETLEPESIDILKHVELLTNPFWGKLSKLALLQHKQRNPQAFDNICVYCEALKIISDQYLKLSARRMVHELFLDVKYIKLRNEAKTVLKRKYPSSSISKVSEETVTDSSAKDCPHDEHNNLSQSEDDSSSIQFSNRISQNLKSLDGLKLIYKENKFPIKNRDM